MLWFGADNNNALQLLLKPVLSFSNLFVFPDVMHELNLTDGSFSAETTDPTVNSTNPLVNSSTIVSSIYLSGLASMCKLPRKSIRVKVSKCLKENIFTEMKKSNYYWKIYLSPRKTLMLDCYYTLTLFSFCMHRKKIQSVKDLVVKVSYRCSKEVKVVGQPFVWGRSSPLYTG